MLLQYYQTEFSIPHTSKCHLKTSGLVNNGGQVTIASPVFSSIDYNSKALTLSSEFTVPIRLNQSQVDLTGDEDAVLVCDDNDIFGMYVKIV